LTSERAKPFSKGSVDGNRADSHPVVFFYRQLEPTTTERYDRRGRYNETQCKRKRAQDRASEALETGKESSSMPPLSNGRTLCGLGVFLFLSACGGGGSDGSSGPPGSPPGPAPTFSVSTPTLNFATGIPNNTPPTRKIQAAISGPVNGALYIANR
jgi:hypothetical protein